MTGIEEAVLLLSGIITVIGRSAEAFQAVNALIEKAKSEGRDITPLELDAVIATRNDAMDRWNEVTGE